MHFKKFLNHIQSESWQVHLLQVKKVFVFIDGRPGTELKDN